MEKWFSEGNEWTSGKTVHIRALLLPQFLSTAKVSEEESPPYSLGYVSHRICGTIFVSTSIRIRNFEICPLIKWILSIAVPYIRSPAGQIPSVESYQYFIHLTKKETGFSINYQNAIVPVLFVASVNRTQHVTGVTQWHRIYIFAIWATVDCCNEFAFPITKMFTTGTLRWGLPSSAFKKHPVIGSNTDFYN